MNDRTSASKAAKELSRLGASKGGRARANLLSAEERRSIASKAARTRWDRLDEPAGGLVATVESGDTTPYSLFRGTLTINDVSFECHVLNDHRRVLTQREVVRALSG